MKTYIIFELVQGSKCWTIAHTDPRQLRSGEEFPPVPVTRNSMKKAREWIEEVGSKRLGWWAGKPNQRPFDYHIAEVELPE